jgi:hypothetical protein
LGAAGRHFDLHQGRAHRSSGKGNGVRPATDLAVASSGVIEPTGASTLR